MKSRAQRDQRHRGISGTFGHREASAEITEIHEKLTKAHQDPPGDSRTHPGSTRDAPGARRTTFYFISQQSQAPTPRARASTRRTNPLKKPSLRITRSQEPLRFPGRTHPPTSDTALAPEKLLSWHQRLRYVGTRQSAILEPESPL